MVRRYSLPLLLLLFAPLAMQAQSQVFRWFQTDSPVDLLIMREVMEAVNDLDPHSTVYFSDDRTQVQVKISPQVSVAEIHSTIVGKGVVLLTTDGTPPPPVTTAPDGSPLYVVTGDTAGDRARYEAAVAEWNAANPERAMELPVNVPNQ